MKSTFPVRLKQARIAKNLSQLKLGEIVGIKSTIICTYEKGKRRPNLDVLKKLKKVLGVSLDWLAGDSDEKFKKMEINPQEMILELRERLKDRDALLLALQKNEENKMAMLANKDVTIELLKEENERLRKDRIEGTVELYRKKG